MPTSPYGIGVSSKLSLVRTDFYVLDAESFQTFPNMLLSKLVSPAAKRMCLHILYAIFVIGPANLHCDPWVEAG